LSWGNEHHGQGFAFERLDQDGAVVPSLGHALHFVEQHRLADSTQSGQQHTFLGSFPTNARKQHLRLFQNILTTRQLGRRRARAGRERIDDFVHAEPRALFMSIYSSFIE
jgi:hypothetical protein